MRKILTSAATRVSARLIAAALQASTLVILARQVIPSEFGLFGQAQSLGMMATAILGFGFSTRALVLTDGAGSKSTITAMYIIRIASAALAFVVIAGGFTLFQSNLAYGVLAAASVIFSDMISDLTQGVLSGARKHELAATLLIVHRALPLIVIAISVGVNYNPFVSLFWANLVTSIFAAIPLLKFLARPMGLKSLVNQGKGYWFASASGPVIQLDTSVVRAVSDLSSVGLYAAAARIGTPLNIVTSSLVNILVPEMVRSTSPGRKRTMFERLRRVSLIMSLLIALLAVPIARVTIWFLGSPYQPAFILMFSVIVGAGISGINQVYQAYFYSLDRPKVAGFAIIFGTIAGLLLLALGGLIWGLFGLAIGPVAVQLMILISFVFHDRKRKDRHLA